MLTVGEKSCLMFFPQGNTGLGRCKPDFQEQILLFRVGLKNASALGDYITEQVPWERLTDILARLVIITTLVETAWAYPRVERIALAVFCAGHLAYTK